MSAASRIVADDRVARYVGEKVDRRIFPPFTALGIERDGRIVAGAVFNCFTGYDTDVTVAGERGVFTREFIRQVGRYVFYQIGCLRMSIITQQPEVMDFAERLGAEVEGRKRNHFGPGCDAVLLGILREDWKVRW